MRSFQSIVILLLCFSSKLISAQTGYRLDFKIKSWKDTTVYLGSWMGETNVVKDTAQVKQGVFHFDGKKALPQGVYYLILAKTKLFEFVIGDDQFFSMETHASGYLKIDEYVTNIVVKGDVDNQLYFEDIAFNIEQNKAAMPLIKILKDSTQKEDQKKEARAAFSKINEEVMKHQKEIFEKHPTTMTARRLKADQSIVIPDPPKKPNGTIDSTFQLRYYRQHFFDNFDLADPALLHLSKTLYQEKIKEYLTKLFIPQPDTITKAIDGLVSKAKKNQETYKYSVLYCLIAYQQPEIMGLDEVYVNLYDKYVATGEMDFWMDARLKQNLKEFANKIRSSMIGRPGANLTMQDANFKPQSMYDIKAKYTILFIFKPECGHCREETPKLIDFYNKNKTKYDLEVFAVATDTSMKLMRDFIKEFKTPWITVDGPRSYGTQHFMSLYHADTTPTIYILDDKKIIIAKRIPVHLLDDFLSRHEKLQEAKRRGVSK